MKKAIVSGSLGLVGRPVVNYLLDNGIDVLCLGRKNLNKYDINSYFNKRVKYIQLDMENIKNLSDKINQLNWEVGKECSFYNFAWSGVNKLTDGTLKNHQLSEALAFVDGLKYNQKTIDGSGISVTTINTVIAYFADFQNVSISNLNSAIDLLATETGLTSVKASL